MDYKPDCGDLKVSHKCLFSHSDFVILKLVPSYPGPVLWFAMCHPTLLGLPFTMAPCLSAACYLAGADLRRLENGDSDLTEIRDECGSSDVLVPPCAHLISSEKDGWQLNYKENSTEKSKPLIGTVWPQLFYHWVRLSYVCPKLVETSWEILNQSVFWASYWLHLCVWVFAYFPSLRYTLWVHEQWLLVATPLNKMEYGAKPCCRKTSICVQEDTLQKKNPKSCD